METKLLTLEDLPPIGGAEQQVRFSIGGVYPSSSVTISAAATGP